MHFPVPYKFFWLYKYFFFHNFFCSFQICDFAILFHPFVPNTPYLYPLKISENCITHLFSDLFPDLQNVKSCLCMNNIKTHEASSSLLKVFALHRQDFIRFLKVERFPADLICRGKLFHIFGHSALKLFSSKLTWFGLIVSKFRTCCLRAALFDDDNLKILDINLGFSWFKVL